MGDEQLQTILDVVNVGTLGLVVWLWLSGRLTRPADCDHRVAAAERDRDGMERERDAAHDTLAQVRSDRDTWREAAIINAESRQIADLVNRQLVESSRVTVDLVEVLRDLATRAPGKE